MEWDTPGVGAPRGVGVTVLSFVGAVSLVLGVLWTTQAAASGDGAPAAYRSPSVTVPATSTTTTLPPTTTTTTPPPPPTTTTTAPPPPPTTTVPPPPPPPAALTSAALPARGEATAWGCGPALTYMRAYADPTFELVCPGDAQGHQAVTCFGEAPCAPGQRMIAINDPCPAAYMNEAHNSWVLDNEATGSPIPDGSSVIDPFGYCH